MAIQIKASHKGRFTNTEHYRVAAMLAGMSVQAYASRVLKDPNASVVTKRQANFARNAKSFNHNGKSIKKAGSVMRRAAGVK